MVGIGLMLERLSNVVSWLNVRNSLKVSASTGILHLRRGDRPWLCGRPEWPDTSDWDDEDVAALTLLVSGR